VELLAALVGAGVGVGVVVDGLECSFGILECHLLILVILLDNLMVSLPLLRRCAIVARLQLLLLVELLRKLLDLPALLGAVALRVVRRAIRGLSWPLVTTWARTPLAVVAAAVGAPTSGLSLLSAFFFFFLPLL
jgi:hypothetical protein